MRNIFIPASQIFLPLFENVFRSRKTGKRFAESLLSYPN